MAYDPDILQQRSESQLLTDFAGPLPEQQKLLNLIYSIYRGLAEAKAIATLSAQSENLTINEANHSGQVIVFNASADVTVTLADNLPAGATGSIINAGSSKVSLMLESGSPKLIDGKSASITGVGTVMQWVKTAAGTVVFGSLDDAA